MPAQQKKKASSRSVVDDLSRLAELASDIANNEAIDEMDWDHALLALAREEDLHVGPDLAHRYMVQAKAMRDGRKSFLGSNDTLELRSDEWIWHGVLMREASNLVFAHPKVGKTRLMLGALAAFLKGEPDFAGVRLNPGPEKLLILGPDQSTKSWGHYLKQVGLLTEEQKLHPKIVGMATSSHEFQLSKEWLVDVEKMLREHGPLIVLLDSYSAATSSIVLDENKSAAALPFQKLHNLCGAYGSTLIVIHHSNKGTQEGEVSKVARGSSAIPASADNLISLTTFEGEGEHGVKKYQLKVTGRSETDGVPVIGYSKASKEWRSFGSTHELMEEKAQMQAFMKLTDRQRHALAVLVKKTVLDGEGYTVRGLAEVLHEKVMDKDRVATDKILKRLVELGFAEKRHAGTSKMSHFTSSYFLATGFSVAQFRDIDL